MEHNKRVTLKMIQWTWYKANGRLWNETKCSLFGLPRKNLDHHARINLISSSLVNTIFECKDAIRWQCHLLNTIQMIPKCLNITTQSQYVSTSDRQLIVWCFSFSVFHTNVFVVIFGIDSKFYCQFLLEKIFKFHLQHFWRDFFLLHFVRVQKLSINSPENLCFWLN